MTEPIPVHELMEELNLFQRKYSSIEQTVLKKNQLNRSAFFIMQQLIEQSLTLTELVHISSLNKSTLSRQVNDLVEKGWVIKVPEEDKRLIQLILSKGAKQKVHTVQFEIEHQLTQVFSSWPDEEKQLLIILIRRINRKIELVVD